MTRGQAGGEEGMVPESATSAKKKAAGAPLSDFYAKDMPVVQATGTAAEEVEARQWREARRKNFPGRQAADASAQAERQRQLQLILRTQMRLGLDKAAGTTDLCRALPQGVVESTSTPDVGGVPLAGVSPATVGSTVGKGAGIPGNGPRIGKRAKVGFSGWGASAYRNDGTLVRLLQRPALSLAGAPCASGTSLSITTALHHAVGEAPLEREEERHGQDAAALSFHRRQRVLRRPARRVRVPQVSPRADGSSALRRP